MFTGLVEAQGKITSTEKNSSSYRIRIECPFAEELTLGESVAVNGICL
ncbi:MAG: riboflavin synthase, partial [Treponema sp.]|nr:riboflavin synthase [Treponema sp.]